MLCTEYMARGNGSFFIGSLPVAKVHNVGMINWGLVEGKSQTHLPWDSWQRPYTDREPAVWFHESSARRHALHPGGSRVHQAHDRQGEG